MILPTIRVINKEMIRSTLNKSLMTGLGVSLQNKPKSLTLSAELEDVASAPVATTRAADGLRIANTRSSQTTVLLAGAGQAAQFSVLLHSGADPVDFGVATDCLVEGIDADDLKAKWSLKLENVYFAKFCKHIPRRT